MVKVGVYLNQGDDGHDPLESEIVADKDCKDAEDRSIVQYRASVND